MSVSQQWVYTKQQLMGATDPSKGEKEDKAVEKWFRQQQDSGHIPPDDAKKPLTDALHKLSVKLSDEYETESKKN